MGTVRWSVWLIGLAAGACAASAATDASLAGKRWTARLAGVEDAKQLPRLEFLGNGRLAGYTGCNALSGTWRVEGGEVRLGALAATKRGCLGPSGAVEQRVLAALNERSRVTLEGGRLVVQGAGGERLEFAESSSTP